MQADCSQKKKVTDFGKVDTEVRRINRDHPQAFVSEPEARYVRARLVLDTQAVCAWSLTIRDQDLRPVQTLAASDFGPTSVVWTSRVRGPALTVELHNCPGNSGPLLTVNRVIWMPATTVLGPDAYYSLKTFAVPDWTELYLSLTDSKRMIRPRWKREMSLASSC